MKNKKYFVICTYPHILEEHIEARFGEKFELKYTHSKKLHRTGRIFFTSLDGTEVELFFSEDFGDAMNYVCRKTTIVFIGDYDHGKSRQMRAIVARGLGVKTPQVFAQSAICEWWPEKNHTQFTLLRKERDKKRVAIFSEVGT